MALQLDLNKSSQALKLNLAKRGITTPPAIDVAFSLDVSGSFDDEHQSGITDQLLTRLVPWGLVFDPDKKMDVFTFSNVSTYVGEVNQDNYVDYVYNEIVENVPGYGWGTQYAPVIQLILSHFNWVVVKQKPQPVKEPQSPSFFQKIKNLFGKPQEEQPQQPQPELFTPVVIPSKPSLVLFVTDGDNGDAAETYACLKQSQANHHKVFFMFIGISNEGSTFPFLKKINEEFSNVSFFEVKNLQSFTNQSDDQINDQLITDKLTAWLTK